MVHYLSSMNYEMIKLQDVILKAKMSFYCANNTRALPLCSDFIYKERVETFSLCLEWIIIFGLTSLWLS